MGNTNTSISLPDSEGKPLFCGWEPLRLSGCFFSAVLCIHLAGSWDGWGGRRRLCLHGTVWPFQPGRTQCAVSQPCGPAKVRHVRLDQCACPAAASPGVCCQSGEKWSRQAFSLFRDFLVEHTSKCRPLCGERDACWMNTACWAACLSLKRLQRPARRTAARRISDSYMFIS